MNLLQRLSGYITVLTIFLTLCSSTAFGQACPDPVITLKPDPICNPPVELTVTPTDTYITYLWNTGATTDRISVAVSGTYSVTVKCADGSSKSTSITATVPNRQARFASSILRPCLLGDDVLISLQLVGTPPLPGPHEFMIISSFNDTIIYNNEMAPFGFVVNPSVITSYRLVTAKSLISGCSYPIGVPNKVVVTPVFEDPSQLPTLDGDLFYCKGSQTTLTLNVSQDPDSILWTNQPTFNTQSPTFTTGVAGSYVVRTVYGGQCSVAIPFEIEEIAPSPVIQGSFVCIGNPSTITTTEPFVEYEWSNGDTGPIATVDQPGLYTVTITDTKGCTGTATKFLQGAPLPNPFINGPEVLCSTQPSITLVANAPNIVNYAWSTGATSINIFVTEGGSYTVTVTDNKGCTNEITQNVEAIMTPTASMLATPLCAGGNVTLDPVTSSEDVAYLWSNGATTSTITITTSGLYRVTVSDPSLTCNTTTFTNVTVVPLPVATITTATPQFCEGKTATLIASGPGTFAWSTGTTGAVLNTTVGGTYTVTITNSVGCKSTSSIAVTLVENPKPQILGPRSLCGKDSILLSIGGSFPNKTWSTGDTSSAIWIKNVGNYGLLVSNSFGCTGTAIANITVSTPGTVAIAGAASLCNKDSLILVASGPFTNYTWNNGIKNDSLIVKTGGDYTVLATDALGCTSSRSVNIGNGGNFVAAVGFKALCDQTVRLEADPSFSAYAWSSGSTLSFEQTGSLGNYTVTVTNADGCTSTSTYAVTVLPQAPTPAVTAPVAICPGNSGTLALTDTYPGIAWSTGSNNTSVSINQSGIFTVTVTDQYGCTGDKEVTVGAFPVPQVDIAGSTTLCNGTQSVLSVGGTYSSIEWSTGVSTASTTIASAGTYTVTVSNNNGCTATSATTVTTANFLTPNIAVDPYDCNNQLSLNAGTSYSTYLWSTGATTNTIGITLAGNYTLTVTDDLGCTGTAAQNISSIPTTPTLAIQGEIVFCDNIGTDLTATPGFNTYLWSNGNNASQINVSTSANYTVTATDSNGCTATAVTGVVALAAPTPSISVLPSECNGLLSLSSGGPYTAYLWNDNSAESTLIIATEGAYTVTVTNAEGCTGVDNIQVTNIPDRPTVEITGTNRICPNGTGTISASTGFTNYLWSNGDISADIIVNEATTYTVTVTDIVGCTATSEIQVELLDAPTPDLGQEPYTCNGNITLAVSGVFAAYNWSSGGISNTETVNTSGLYTVTVTSVDGCTGTTAQQVTIPTAPSTQITQTPAANFTVDLSTDAGFQSYNWSDGNQTISTNVATSGIYTVTVTDSNNCTATATTSVTIVPPPLTVLSNPTSISCFNANDGTLTLCINGGQSPYTIVSAPPVPSQGTSTPECTQLVTYSGIPAGGFSWSVTDANGTIFSDIALFPNPSAINATAAVSLSTITVSATGGTPGLEYSIDGINYQSSAAFTNIPNGTYTVSVRDANGCIKTIPDVVVMVSGTTDLVRDWKVQILPNPSNGFFTLKMDNCGSDQIQVSIWDIAGRAVRQLQLSTDNCYQVSQAIDLSDAPAGSYLVQVRTENAALALPVVIVR